MMSKIATLNALLALIFCNMAMLVSSQPRGASLVGGLGIRGMRKLQMDGMKEDGMDGMVGIADDLATMGK